MGRRPRPHAIPGFGSRRLCGADGETGLPRIRGGSNVRIRRSLAFGSSLVLLASLVVVVPASTALAASPGVARSIAVAGTTSPQTGDFTPSGDWRRDPGRVSRAGRRGRLGPAPYPGTIVNRSLSSGTGNGVSVNSGKKAKSNPTVQHRLRRPEPLPAALRARRQPVHGRAARPGAVRRQRLRGRGRERRPQRLQHVRAVGAAGQHRAPTSSPASRRNVNHAVDLNSFFGYAPAINRATGVRGAVRDRPELPVRRGDAALLRRRADAGDAPERVRSPHVNHIDIAVSKTSNPTGPWNIYRVDVTQRRHQHRRRTTPARTSATTRTSARTPTASTSRRTRTRGAATASPARRSTRSRRRSWRPAPPT